MSSPGESPSVFPSRPARSRLGRGGAPAPAEQPPFEPAELLQGQSAAVLAALARVQLRLDVLAREQSDMLAQVLARLDQLSTTAGPTVTQPASEVLAATAPPPVAPAAEAQPAPEAAVPPAPETAAEPAPEVPLAVDAEAPEEAEPEETEPGDDTPRRKGYQPPPTSWELPPHSTAPARSWE